MLPQAHLSFFSHDYDNREFFLIYCFGYFQHVRLNLNVYNENENLINFHEQKLIFTHV